MSFPKKVLVAVLVVAVAVAVGFYSFRRKAVVARVIKDTAVMVVPGSVVITAYEAPLLSEASGRIVSSELDPGQEVKQGAVLVQLDTADLVLEIERIESDFAAAKERITIGSQIELELSNAEETLKEAESRAKLNNYPEAQLIRDRRTVQQIQLRRALEGVANKQSLETYENTLKVKRLQLSRMTITAPYDCVITEVMIGRVGQLIGSGTTIARIIATDRTVEAKISEENFAGIKLGQPANVRFLGYGEGLYEGSVSKILPTADPLTQRYIVHLSVKIAPEKLVPGLTGDVTIQTGEHANALVIPRRALFGSSVYVVNGKQVEFRSIKTGFTSLNAVEVLEGLNEGDLVIVDELESFREGDRVRVTIEEDLKA